MGKNEGGVVKEEEGCERESVEKIRKWKKVGEGDKEGRWRKKYK